MKKNRFSCFIIMPFLPELYYFYLYVKKHIEETHGISCERADAQTLTKPFPDKVSDYVKKADVIIVDCTGRNANVFYELGQARAANKNVIMITKDPIKDTPSDVRHYEVIPYELDKHTEFLKNLDNALQNVFVGRYKSLYRKAEKTYQEFSKSTRVDLPLASEQDFVSRVLRAEATGEWSSANDEGALERVLLPKIIQGSDSFDTMTKITEWFSSKSKSPAKHKKS